jgi:hypothetical protein
VTGHETAPGDTGRPGAARVGFAIARLVLAVAIVAAIVGQLTRSLGYWDARGDEDIPGDLVNFFSYFTMESNAAAAITLAIGSGPRRRRSRTAPMARVIAAAAFDSIVK